MGPPVPNFIANRIGTFSALGAMRLLQEEDLTIEEVPPLLGRDNYRVLDVHLFYTSVHARAVDRVEAYLAATARP